MAREERTAVAEEVPALEQGLLLSLVPEDSIDERGVIVEVRGCGCWFPTAPAVAGSKGQH